MYSNYYISVNWLVQKVSPSLLWIYLGERRCEISWFVSEQKQEQKAAEGGLSCRGSREHTLGLWLRSHLCDDVNHNH